MRLTIVHYSLLLFVVNAPTSGTLAATPEDLHTPEVRHRVESTLPTLSHIARHYYGRASGWPEIALDNQITAPFWIFKGQILKIKQQPQQMATAQHKTIARETLKTTPYKFQTSADTHSLTLASLYLYGSTRHWIRIAKWNHIKPPYQIRKNQTLTLYMRPTLTQKEGDLRLLHYWRKTLTQARTLQPHTPPRRTPSTNRR